MKTNQCKMYENGMLTNELDKECPLYPLIAALLKQVKVGQEEQVDNNGTPPRTQWWTHNPDTGAHYSFMTDGTMSSGTDGIIWSTPQPIPKIDGVPQHFIRQFITQGLLSTPPTPHTSPRGKYTALIFIRELQVFAVFNEQAGTMYLSTDASAIAWTAPIPIPKIEGATFNQVICLIREGYLTSMIKSALDAAIAKTTETSCKL